MSWLETPDILHECEGFLDGTEGEARPKSIKIDCPWDPRVDQCPGFGCEPEFVISLVNVQLLDSDWISCKYDLLGVVEPDGDGKRSPELAEGFIAPGFIRLECDFCFGLDFELDSFCLERFP